MEDNKPTKIIQIGRDFIIDFYRNANATDRAWIKAKETEKKAEKGADKLFYRFSFGIRAPILS